MRMIWSTQNPFIKYSFVVSDDIWPITVRVVFETVGCLFMFINYRRETDMVQEIPAASTLSNNLPGHKDEGDEYDSQGNYVGDKSKNC